MISPDAYDRVLAENPELHVHPLRLTPARCENDHFKMEEVKVEEPYESLKQQDGHEEDGEVFYSMQSSLYNLGTMEGEEVEQTGSAIDLDDQLRGVLAN